MNLYNILSGNVPEWYRLNFDSKSKSIIINIPRSTEEELFGFFSRQPIPIIQDLQKNLELPDFIYPKQNKRQQLLPFWEDYDCWGFQEVITSTRNNHGDLVFTVGLPIPEDGNWANLYCTSATLAIIFPLLGCCETTSKRKQNQLLAINYFGCERDIYGGSLSVNISLELSNWLATMPDGFYCKPIVNAMRAAWMQMDGRENELLFHHSFYAVFRQPSRIHLSCPGNACGLDPDTSLLQPGEGYKLLPHNTDNPKEQLTLLAGVAALYQLARNQTKE